MLTAGQLAKTFKQVARNWARLAVADQATIETRDGDDFRRRTCKKALVGDVDVVPQEGRFRNRDLRLTGQPDDGVAGDPLENSSIHRGCFERSPVNDEDVVAGA